jgi:hypothetical protein
MANWRAGKLTPDSVTWILEPLGEFSTASLYKALHEGVGVFRFKELWKTKVSLKIKIFIWQMARGRISSGGSETKRTCILARFFWAAFS